MMYSQNDEEAVILKYFETRPPTERVFLDIGAYDGVTFSNTKALADKGWRGTLVEASPMSFAALKRAYADRPDCNLVQALVGFDWRVVRFWDSPDAVGTSDPEHYEKWKSVGQYQPVFLTETPIHAILGACPGPYPFINIDVEGIATRQIFEALPYRDLGTKLVCVEVNDDREPFRKFARSRNMEEIHATGENLLFRIH